MTRLLQAHFLMVSIVFNLDLDYSNSLLTNNQLTSVIISLQTVVSKIPIFQAQLKL